MRAITPHELLFGYFTEPENGSGLLEVNWSKLLTCSQSCSLCATCRENWAAIHGTLWESYMTVLWKMSWLRLFSFKFDFVMKSMIKKLGKYKTEKNWVGIGKTRLKYILKTLFHVWQRETRKFQFSLPQFGSDCSYGSRKVPCVFVCLLIILLRQSVLKINSWHANYYNHH